MAQRIGDPTCDHSGHIEPAVPGVFGPGVVCSVCARIMSPQAESSAATNSYNKNESGRALMSLVSRAARRQTPVCRCGQPCTEIIRGACCQCRRDLDCCQFCDI